MLEAPFAGAAFVIDDEDRREDEVRRFLEDQAREIEEEHLEINDEVIEAGMRAEAEYEAMLEHQQERECRHYQLELDYDAMRAEVAEREAEADAELELDFEISIELAIRAETEGEDAAVSAALSQHEAQRALDGVNAYNDRTSARDLLADYGAPLSLALLERSRIAALHEDTREAVPALVGLLRSGTDGQTHLRQTAQNAAAALANLTVTSPANRVATLQAAAVPPLVGLLQPELAGAFDAARALHNIAWRNAAAKIAVREAGGIERLSALLEGRHAEVAALTLWTLTAGSHENQLAVLRSGGLTRLVGLAQKGASSPAARMAAGALGEFGAGVLLSEPRVWGLGRDPLHAAQDEAAPSSSGAFAPLVDMLHARPGQPEFSADSAANVAAMLHTILVHVALAGALPSARKVGDAIIAAVMARGRLPLPCPTTYPPLSRTLRNLDTELKAVIVARLRAAAAPSAEADGAALRELLKQAVLVGVPATELAHARARLKTIERRERLGLQSAETPDEFLCPITYEVMEDPVVASDGHSYERSAIEHYYAQEGIRHSPLTRVELELDGSGRLRLFPNIALRKRIDDYEPELESVAERAAALAEQRVRIELRQHGGGRVPGAKVARRA